MPWFVMANTTQNNIWWYQTRIWRCATLNRASPPFFMYLNSHNKTYVYAAFIVACIFSLSATHTAFGFGNASGGESGSSSGGESGAPSGGGAGNAGGAPSVPNNTNFGNASGGESGTPSGGELGSPSGGESGSSSGGEIPTPSAPTPGPSVLVTPPATSTPPAITPTPPTPPTPPVVPPTTPPTTPPPSGGGSGGGGSVSSAGGSGGGLNSPRVTLDQIKTPDEQELAFVYLSQVPYTGFETGTAGQALFWTLLVIWSALVSYAFAFGRIGNKLFSFAFEKSENSNLNELEHVANHEPSARAHVSPPANLPVGNVHSSEYGNSQNENNSNGNNEIYRKLEELMHRESILCSPEVIRILAQRSKQDMYKAQALCASIVEKAKAEYPREDGYISMNRIRLESLMPEVDNENSAHTDNADSAIPVATSQTATTSAFISWVVGGEHEKIFTFLRRLGQGESAYSFIGESVCALDDVYRNRRGDSRMVDEHLVECTQKLSDQELERLIAVLSEGVDRSYSHADANVRTAVVRALTLLKK